MANAFPRTMRSLRANTSKSALFTWAGMAILLLMWLAWFFLVNVSVYEISQNARLEVVRAAHPVSTPITGQVIKTAISLGRKVEVGEILVELDSRSERLQLAEEQSRITSIPVERNIVLSQKTTFNEVMRIDEITAAKAVNSAHRVHDDLLNVADFEKENARRMEVLQSTGQLAELDLLRARLTSDQSQSAVDTQSREIERLASDVSSKLSQQKVELLTLDREIAVLDRQLDLSKAIAARLQEEIEKRVIRAPVSGAIGSIAQLDIGAVVNVGDVIANIIPPGALKIVADYPPERVLGRIHRGQQASMKLDVFPWAQYGSVEAQVDQVASEINHGRIRVEFSLADSIDRNRHLQNGLTGSVAVNVETTTPAMLVLRATGQVIAKPTNQNALIATAVQ